MCVCVGGRGACYDCCRSEEDSVGSDADIIWAYLFALLYAAMFVSFALCLCPTPLYKCILLYS